MLYDFKLGQGSVVLRVKIRNSTTGQGLTGLTLSSTGLIIGTIADNESTATVYTAAASTIETITTLGTFSTPTATKCRFKEVDATNHPGLYEVQLANARFAVSSAKSLQITLSGAANMAECDACIPLRQVDPYSATAFMTGINSLAPPTNWNLVSIDGSGRVDIGKWVGSVVNALISGKVDSNAQVVGDKTGYALTSGEHTAISNDTQVGLTSQGYNPTRAGYLDTLNGLVTAQTSAIWNALLTGISTAGSIGLLVKTNLDALISSRLGTGNVVVGSYASGQDPATYVLDAALSAHLSGGSVGAGINSASSAGDPWNTMVPGAYLAGSAGSILGNNLNAKVGDVKTKTDNLPASPAAVGSGMTLTGGALDAIWGYLLTSIATVGSVGQLIKDFLNAAIDSRLASGNVTVGGYAVNQDPAKLVLDATASAHNIDTTIGSKINASGSASDPLANAVSGYSTATGSVGKLLGDNLNTPISAVKAKTDLIPATPASTGDAMTLTGGERTTLSGIIATSVWSALLTAMTTVGSIGVLIKTNLNAAITSITGGSGGGGPVIVADYALGKSPQELLLVNPNNKILTNTDGTTPLDLTQALDNSIRGDKVGRALVAALAQGLGRWKLVGSVLTLYAQDSTTVVGTCLIDNLLAPTERTPQ